VSRLVHVLSGALFAAGLVLAGMTEPAKVIGFLDFFGNWDPSLALVMLGAIAVHHVAYRLVMKRDSPVFAAAFHLPTRRDADARLIAGSALFGVGWGLAGYCPGPALTSIGTLAPPTLVFGVFMLSSMVLFDRWTRRRQESPVGTSAPSVEAGEADAVPGA
jgi:uncharacterized membrane protein YedE/YeeE